MSEGSRIANYTKALQFAEQQVAALVESPKSMFIIFKSPTKTNGKVAVGKQRRLNTS